MKHCKLFSLLLLSTTVLLLLAVLPATPAQSANERIILSEDEGEIGDKIDVDGSGFEPNVTCRLYFSSIEANIGDEIDSEVTAYEYLGPASIDADGDFDHPLRFTVPSKLSDGKDLEDVHGGIYYVYATSYPDGKDIRDSVIFTVIGGTIELNMEESQVGSKLEISGIRFGKNQNLTIEYDGEVVDIAGGNKETDNAGKFTCIIIIPESTTGTHTITVSDESGNKSEAEFIIKPKITIDPTSGAVGNAITINGTGFRDKVPITVTIDGYRVSTTPRTAQTNHRGSFTCSFLVPTYTAMGISKIEASDSIYSWAEAELTIIAGINLNPLIIQTSPGHVGMEVTIFGTGFKENTTITVTYDESIPVAKTITDPAGNFSTPFIIPPSIAGNHAVTATDGDNTLTYTLTIESEAPPIPIPLLPKVATSVEAKAHFDWESVIDPSGVTYTLQVAMDEDLTNIVLEKKNLVESEYTLSEEEQLNFTEADAPYYWRIRAVDGASNEGKWTLPVLFYISPSPKSQLDWTLYVWVGLGIILLSILVLWTLNRTKAL